MATGQIFTCQGRPRIIADVSTGLLFVRGWDDNVVKFEKTSGIMINQKGNKILITSTGQCECMVYVPRNSDVFIDGTNLQMDFAGVEGRCQIDFTDGSFSGDNWLGNLVVDCSGGNVQLTNCRGKIEVDSSAGNVEILASQGEFTFDTGAGGVVVRDSTGSVSIDTGHGSVDISRFSGPVHVDSGKGDVNLQQVFARNVRVFSGRGSINACLPGTVPGRWELETQSGDVELSVPENISAYFELQGRRLTVEDINLDYSNRDATFISGSLGKGEGKISVKSCSGEIRATKIAPATGTNQWQIQDEEALKILRMLEQGSITIDEAEKLLAALNGDNPEEPVDRHSEED